jgi:hypothetical protein
VGHAALRVIPDAAALAAALVSLATEQNLPRDAAGRCRLINVPKAARLEETAVQSGHLAGREEFNDSEAALGLGAVRLKAKEKTPTRLLTEFIFFFFNALYFRACREIPDMPPDGA